MIEGFTLDDVQAAKAFRAVVLDGRPLVPPTVTAPCDVIVIAMQRLGKLRTRAATEADRAVVPDEPGAGCEPEDRVS